MFQRQPQHGSVGDKLPKTRGPVRLLRGIGDCEKRPVGIYVRLHEVMQIALGFLLYER